MNGLKHYMNNICFMIDILLKNAKFYSHWFLLLIAYCLATLSISSADLLDVVSSRESSRVYHVLGVRGVLIPFSCVI